MKSVVSIAAVPLLLVAFAAAPVQAQEGHQHHAPPAAVAHDMSSAQKYETDAPLRKGMREIRAAVDALGHYERGHMGPEQATGFATGVQEQVSYLIANCKLDPQADAALHGIIAKLSAGAQSLKADPTDTTAIPRMREALQQYTHQFNDPGWAGDDEPEEAG